MAYLSAEELLAPSTRECIDVELQRGVVRLEEWGGFERDLYEDFILYHSMEVRGDKRQVVTQAGTRAFAVVLSAVTSDGKKLFGGNAWTHPNRRLAVEQLATQAQSLNKSLLPEELDRLIEAVEELTGLEFIKVVGDKKKPTTGAPISETDGTNALGTDSQDKSADVPSQN